MAAAGKAPSETKDSARKAKGKSAPSSAAASARSGGVAEEDVLPADPLFAVDAPVTMGAHARGTSQRARAPFQLLHFSAALR